MPYLSDGTGRTCHYIVCQRKIRSGGKEMAKKATKAEAQLIGALIIIGLPIYGITMLFETVGWIIPVLVVAAIITLVIWHKHHKKQKRLSYLREKYQNEDVVQKIFDGYFWQGQ